MRSTISMGRCGSTRGTLGNSKRVTVVEHDLRTTRSWDVCAVKTLVRRNPAHSLPYTGERSRARSSKSSGPWLCGVWREEEKRRWAKCLQTTTSLRALWRAELHQPRLSSRPRRLCPTTHLVHPQMVVTRRAPAPAGSTNARTNASQTPARQKSRGVPPPDIALSDSDVAAAELVSLSNPPNSTYSSSPDRINEEGQAKDKDKRQKSRQGARLS
jgi:hypothetical protein